jgi:hypothetical protein
VNGRFGFALIVAVAASLFVCMFPLTRALGKIAGHEVLTFALNQVFWRIAIAVLLACAALALHLRGSRWGWVLLLLAPFLVVAADLVLWLR